MNWLPFCEHACDCFHKNSISPRVTEFTANIENSPLREVRRHRETRFVDLLEALKGYARIIAAFSWCANRWKFIFWPHWNWCIALIFYVNFLSKRKSFSEVKCTSKLRFHPATDFWKRGFYRKQMLSLSTNFTFL